MTQRFYGKYRGTVTDMQDPLNMGRIKAKVPDAMGDQETGWATPCVPFAGKGMGFFALPSVGAGVWMEFEHGDPDLPIWTGGYWGTTVELPPQLLAPPYQKLVIKTAGGNSITLDDTPGVGGIILETAGGQKISMTALGIEINNGVASIVMRGLQIVLNDGALEVT
jgi:uncharacterized protein involved in type VI secretion and phage assembly